MLKLSGKFVSDEHFPFPMMLDKWGVTVIGANWMAQRVSEKKLQKERVCVEVIREASWSSCGTLVHPTHIREVFWILYFIGYKDANK